MEEGRFIAWSGLKTRPKRGIIHQKAFAWVDKRIVVEPGGSVRSQARGEQRETIPREQVEQVKTAEVSLMPEEIEKQLSPREIADLFAFLSLDKPPSDPSAKPLPGAAEIAKA